MVVERTDPRGMAGTTEVGITAARAAVRWLWVGDDISLEFLHFWLWDQGVFYLRLQ
jgi:hypothetical protein